MRGPASWSVACRKPDETIAVEKHPLPTMADRHPWLKWPLVRGVLVLVESLMIGIKALMISANYALDEEDQKLSDKQLGWTLGISMLFFSAVFIALPVLGTKALGSIFGNLETDSPVVFNLIEGSIPTDYVRRLPPRHRADEGHPTRIPVSRRRAQDDLRVRERRSARPEADRRQVLDTARAVRDELPVHRAVPHDHRPHVHGHLRSRPR